MRPWTVLWLVSRPNPSAADFVRFRDDPLILFEDELADVYRVTAVTRNAP